MPRSQEKAFVEMEVAVQGSGLSPELEEKLLKLLEQARAGRVLDTDRWVYRGVVLFLGVAILAALVCTYWITLGNLAATTPIDMPEIFLAIGSAAVGALAGLLAPRPGGDSAES